MLSMCICPFTIASFVSGKKNLLRNTNWEIWEIIKDFFENYK
jgi:hypothetical protein